MNKVSKILSGALCLALSSYSVYSDININSTINDIYSLPLVKGQLSFKASYYKISNDFDIFGSVKSSTENYVLIGDSSGGGFRLSYGISEYASIYYNFDYLDIDLGDSSLKNKKNDLFARVNLYQNDDFFINSVSFDIGYKINKGSDVEIKSDLMLNAIIRSVFPGSHFYIYDGVIKYNGFSGSIYDKNGNKIYPFIKIEDLEDRTSYFRLLFGKKFSSGMIDFYFGYKNINIETNFNVYPKNNPVIQETLKKVGIDKVKFNKDEKVIVAGLSYLYNLNDYIFELNYEYSKSDRDVENSLNSNDNHVFNLTVSKPLNSNFIVYVGGAFMLNGLNADIPYLYNTYIKTDEKYGYFKLGFLYNFTY